MKIKVDIVGELPKLNTNIRVVTKKGNMYVINVASELNMFHIFHK